MGKMLRWKRKEPGVGAVPAGACEDEAVAPDADWAETRKA